MTKKRFNLSNDGEYWLNLGPFRISIFSEDNEPHWFIVLHYGEYTDTFKSNNPFIDTKIKMRELLVKSLNEVNQLETLCP